MQPLQPCITAMCTHFWYRPQIAVSQDHWNGTWNLKSIVVLLSSWTRSLWALSYPWGCLWTRSLRSIVSSPLFVQIPVSHSSFLFPFPSHFSFPAFPVARLLSLRNQNVSKLDYKLQEMSQKLLHAWYQNRILSHCTQATTRWFWEFLEVWTFLDT